MLSKTFRLTILDYRQNPAKTKRLLSVHFAFFIKASDNPQTRFAVLVPKKLAKHSAKRNEARRIVIEAIRGLLERIIVSKDILIKLNKIVKKQDRQIIEKEIVTIFKREGLIT